MLPPPLRPQQRNHGLHRHDGPQHIEMEDLVEERRVDLFHRGRIAAPRIVYQPVDATEVPVHGAYCFPYAIELSHVRGNGQTTRKLLRQLTLQCSGAAGEQGNFGSALGQRGRRRQADAR